MCVCVCVCVPHPPRTAPAQPRQPQHCQNFSHTCCSVERRRARHAPRTRAPAPARGPPAATAPARSSRCPGLPAGPGPALRAVAAARHAHTDQAEKACFGRAAWTGPQLNAPAAHCSTAEFCSGARHMARGGAPAGPPCLLGAPEIFYQNSALNMFNLFAADFLDWFAFGHCALGACAHTRLYSPPIPRSSHNPRKHLVTSLAAPARFACFFCRPARWPLRLRLQPLLLSRAAGAAAAAGGRGGGRRLSPVTSSSSRTTSWLQGPHHSSARIFRNYVDALAATTHHEAALVEVGLGDLLADLLRALPRRKEFASAPGMSRLVMQPKHPTGRGAHRPRGASASVGDSPGSGFRLPPGRIRSPRGPPCNRRRQPAGHNRAMLA